MNYNDWLDRHCYACGQPHPEGWVAINQARSRGELTDEEHEAKLNRVYPLAQGPDLCELCGKKMPEEK